MLLDVDEYGTFLRNFLGARVVKDGRAIAYTSNFYLFLNPPFCM